MRWSTDMKPTDPMRQRQAKIHELDRRMACKVDGR